MFVLNWYRVSEGRNIFLFLCFIVYVFMCLFQFLVNCVLNWYHVSKVRNIPFRLCFIVCMFICFFLFLNLFFFVSHSFLVSLIVSSAFFFFSLTFVSCFFICLLCIFLLSLIRLLFLYLSPLHFSSLIRLSFLCLSLHRIQNISVPGIRARGTGRREDPAVRVPEEGAPGAHTRPRQHHWVPGYAKR